MESVVLSYSEFFHNDGGMAKVKADFEKLGEELIAEAKRIKKEVNTNFSFDNPEMLARYEQQISDITKINKQYIQAKKDIAQAEKEEAKAQKEATQAALDHEKVKQAKLKTTRQEIQAEGDLSKAIQAESRAKKQNIDLEIAQARQRSISEKGIKKELDLYGQMSAELNKLFRASANVAVQMFQLEEAGEKASPAYAKLASDFATLQQRTLKLDGSLKQIDASLGRHQRNVGGYKQAYDGLGNSVNQLTRELPAFSNSIQTGLLGISNNIPILADEISNLVRQNQALRAEGKPTVSVLGQITKALGSWQTLLSIGVTLLTIYGAKLVDFIFNTKKAASEIDLLREATERYNDTIVEVTTNSEKELTAMRRKIVVAQDVTKGEEERAQAAQEIIDQYPGYLGNLSKEEVMLGSLTKVNEKYNKAIRSLTGDIQKRIDAEAKQSQARENLKIVAELEREVDIRQRANEEARKAIEAYGFESAAAKNAIKGVQERIKARKELLEDDQEFISKFGSIGIAETGSVTGIGLYVDSQITELQIKAQLLRAEVERQQNEINQTFKETSLLDFNPDQDKNSKAAIDQITQVDYLASQFELAKQILESTIGLNKEIADSDKFTAEQRVEARRAMATQMVALAELERRESLRVLKNEYDKERNETIKDNEGRVLAKKYTDKALLELEKQYGFDKERIQQTYIDKEREAQKEAADVALLDQLDYQVKYLTTMRSFLASNSKIYDDFTKEISIIQNQINKIIDPLKGESLSDAIQINDFELESVRELRRELEKILGGRSFADLTKSEQKSVTKQLEQFEKDRTRTEENFQMQRRLNRLQLIEEEKKRYAEDTNEFKQLEIERQNILLQIEKEGIDKRLKEEKDQAEQFKKFMQDLNSIIGAVLDRMIEITQQRIGQQERLLDQQQNAVELQQKRAEQGAENTLKFEQEQLAKREAELIAQQKREQRLQMIKSLYTAYAGYSEKDPDTAIVKALRDFAILQSITASFGEGGVVEDKLPANGIFRGASHRSKSGGIPIMVEGKEGILSTREMSNLGKDNFYKIKEMAGSGKIDDNFFARQRQSFIQAVGVPTTDDRLISEIQELKRIIDNKPVPTIEANKLADGVLEIAHKMVVGRKEIRNSYIVRKPRL